MIIIKCLCVNTISSMVCLLFAHYRLVAEEVLLSKKIPCSSISTMHVAIFPEVDWGQIAV